LGRSLGIDLVTFKTCSYDCVYCQLGRTTNKTLERKEYVPVAEVLGELERKLASGVNPDYISLAGSGEPTLNSGMGDLIRKIKTLTDIPVAVLTNGSLLWMQEVQDSLMQADLVLPSLDAGEERLFRCVNRSHPGIPFDRMVSGLADFTKRFPGKVWLEIFLLAGESSAPAEVKKIAAIVERIAPDRVQLNTVARPPAEEFALPLSMESMRALSLLFPGPVDILHEESHARPQASIADGVSDADILAILRRHPGTFQDVADAVGIHGTDALKRLDGLVAAGKIKTVTMEKRIFYTVVESGPAEVMR
jgi:wyosine [tRNA(Phe)-imidazoG37] synthetase (radical SAM superfamily)